MSDGFGLAFVCLECSTRFTLNTKERDSRSHARCPGCGSLHFDRAMGGQHVSHIPRASRGQTKDHIKTRQHKALSAPTKYRLVTLQNRHRAVKAKRAAEHRADFDPGNLK